MSPIGLNVFFYMWTINMWDLKSFYYGFLCGAIMGTMVVALSLIIF